MIEVQGLTKRYGDFTAIRDVSFSIPKGQVVGFLGPNGAGKSTTMRILAGSLGATEGKAMVGGRDVAEDPRAVQSILGYAPEVPPVYGNMTVAEYVAFAARLKGVTDIDAATSTALQRVDLMGVKGRLIENLSKGYRQRVGLAQALVHNPQVLVLDEPTSGLDPAQRVEIRDLLAELAAGERTVILSTHVLGEIEAICNHVIIIYKGRIVQDSNLETLGAAGSTVRVEVARRADEAKTALMAIQGVTAVDVESRFLVVRGDRDIREAVGAAAAPFGILELVGRERLEDVYLKSTTGASA